MKSSATSTKARRKVSEETLEPCPFCRCEDIEIDIALYGVCYYCMECGAESRRGKNSQEAAEYWNSRPIEDALRKRVEELEEAIQKICRECWAFRGLDPAQCRICAFNKYKGEMKS